MNLDQIINALSQSGESVISNDLIEIRDLIEERISNNEIEGFCSKDIENIVYIFSYSGWQSRWINSPLRDGKFANDTHENFVAQLNTSLDILTQPTNDFVFRMDDPESHLSISKMEYLNWFKYNIGTVLKIPFFLSTSVDKWEDSPIYWRIRLLRTKSLSRSLEELLHDHSEEKEVLFKTNAHLKILGIKENHIFLEEVLPIENSKNYVKNLFIRKNK